MALATSALAALAAGCSWLDESLMVCESDDNCFPGWFCGESDGDGVRHCAATAAGDDDDATDGGREDLDGDGYSEADGDCDDNDADRNPGVVEDDGNGVDDDCDGIGDTVEELAFEAGATDLALAPLGGDAGSMLAVVFPAPSTSFRVLEVRALFSLVTGPRDLDALLLRTESGEPTHDSVAGPWPMTPGLSGNWAAIDLAESGVRLDDVASFAVALRWPDALPGDGSSPVHAVSAEGGNVAGRTWMVWSEGGAWAPHDSHDASLRVTVRY